MAKKSNNVNDLNSHIWDQWADKNGSIGKAYGYQLGRKAKYPNGEFDQVDRVIWYLKNQPAFRSMITELFVHEDLHEMGLYPCVHGAQFDVTDGKLNLFLNQRSNDTLAAGSWNVVQYATLVYMLAQVCKLKPGKLSHMIVNSHIYDRHIPFIVDITLSRAKLILNRASALNFEAIKKMMTEEEFSNFANFVERLKNSNVNFDKPLKEAQELEFKVENENNFTFDFENYSKAITDTKEFKCVEFIVDTMLNNPSFEKALGFSSPKLILDKNVNNFYNFISPKTRDESGNIIDNANSSFNLENYNYSSEGVKLQAKVPVAE